MRIVRGAFSDVDEDRRVTRELGRITKRTGEVSLRVWTPPRQLAFGRRDSTADGYRRARRVAIDHGFPAVERSVGGNAVAYTGTTVAFTLVVPTKSGRPDIGGRYRKTTATLLQALESVGARVSSGEPTGSFCPGEHSIQGNGKIAGIAQRVKRESAAVGGYIVVSQADEAPISSVLEPVYAALEIPFDPETVGSVQGAGAVVDVQATIEAIESAFVAEKDVTVLSAETVAAEGRP